MALDDLVRNGVALANSLTGSLQVVVTHEAWVGEDRFGKNSYAAPVSLAALVETNQRKIRTSSGEDIWVNHTISILQPVAANGAANRKEPIDPRDRLVLPDGSTGKIVSVNGFSDPDTSASYFYQVGLG